MVDAGVPAAGPNVIELLKQNMLLTRFLLSNNRQDTSRKFYMFSGILAGNFFSGWHDFVLLS